MTEISETTAEEASVPSVQVEEVAGHTPTLFVRDYGAMIERPSTNEVKG